MLTKELIQHLHNLIEVFSNEAGALAVDFTENKKRAVWSIKYNIIKLEFALTKKEKIVCPMHTLFCRVYLGKNENYFYHLPELMQYLEPDNFQCYYYPYIDSKERLEACFAMLGGFLRKHYNKINEFAKNIETSERIKAEKLEDMLRLYLSEVPEPDLEEGMLEVYEEYVLLIRYTGDAAYRQLLCGNYEEAMKMYGQMEKKGSFTGYEKRLYEFLKSQNSPYELLPKECNSVKRVKEWDKPSKEGLSILLTALAYELVLGVIFALIVAIINAVLSKDTVYYAGESWGYGFLMAGLPAVFGGIAHRNLIRRFLQKDMFEEGQKLEAMINPGWVEPFTRIVFGVVFVGSFALNILIVFMSTSFYTTHMSFDASDALLRREQVTCEYSNLQNVYYSDGVYNDFGDFIDRPSYLLEFEGGIVWDSDGYMSVEDVERHVLPILNDYYDEIEHIEARNNLIK